MIDRLQTGNFLAELRRERGLTQAELAEKLAVSGKTVSRWETGQTLPDYEQMQMLCDLFSVRIEEVLAAKRSDPSDGRPIVPNTQTAAPQRRVKGLLRAGWIVAVCGILTSCVLFALLMADRCKKPTAASVAETTPEPTVSTPEPTVSAAENATATASTREWKAKYTAADLPAALAERRLSDDELIALKDASPSVLKARISTVADMLAWFNVTEPEMWDSYVNNTPGTCLFSYETPAKQFINESFAADSLAIPCAWLIRDDYPELCVLYVNGSNCFNVLCIGVPTGDGWFVFQPASFMPHGGLYDVLECVTVQSLSDLYPILDEFNATHHEQLTPIHRIDNPEQYVTFYEDDTTKHIYEGTDAVEIPR